MNLREELLAMKPREKLVEIEGCKFLVVGLSRLERSKLLAAMRGSQSDLRPTNDAETVERQFLCACVRSPETRQPLIELHEETLWDSVPSHVSAQLIVAVRWANFIDDDDVKKN